MFNDNITIFGNIMVTENYDMFKKIGGNRKINKSNYTKIVKSMKEELKNLIERSKSSSIIKNGIQTVILGRPNVGKSSILNKLLDEEKAIVTNVAGTTRDIVEGQTFIDGILIKFIDTAGIRKTDDIVEKIGVEKSLKAVEDADLIILVLNNNEELTAEDLEILEKTKDKQRIIVINKKDLERNIKLPENLENVVETDTNSIEGIDSLKSKIKEMFNLEKITTKDYTYLSNSRQISLITKAYQSILSAEKSLNESLPIDLIAIDLKECFDLLGQVIGISYTDEIIDNLFENFCVGK